MGKIYAGTSGWGYYQFKPEFYPAGLKAGDYLEFYASKLPSVEVNNSFYRPPSPVMIAKWRAAVPTGFKFAVKAWQEITHVKTLRNCEGEVAMFNNILDSFGDNLGPVLFQLPPRLQCDPQLLEAFLRILPPGRQYAIEFRHPSWYVAGIKELLGEYDIAMCISHMKEWSAPLVRTAQLVYIRLHGATRLYEGSYSDEFITRLGEWLDKAGAGESHVYFNNTKGSSAAAFNALKLLETAN